jgi:hypothetical protein
VETLRNVGGVKAMSVVQEAALPVVGVGAAQGPLKLEDSSMLWPWVTHQERPATSRTHVPMIFEEVLRQPMVGERSDVLRATL